MKKSVVFLFVSVPLIAAVSVAFAAGGPPIDVGYSVIQQLIDVFTLLAEVLPAFLLTLFEAIIDILTSLLGGAV